MRRNSGAHPTAGRDRRHQLSPDRRAHPRRPDLGHAPSRSGSLVGPTHARSPNSPGTTRSPIHRVQEQRSDKSTPQHTPHVGQSPDEGRALGISDAMRTRRILDAHVADFGERTRRRRHHPRIAPPAPSRADPSSGSQGSVGGRDKRDEQSRRRPGSGGRARHGEHPRSHRSGRPRDLAGDLLSEFPGGGSMLRQERSVHRETFSFRARREFTRAAGTWCGTAPPRPVGAIAPGAHPPIGGPDFRLIGARETSFYGTARKGTDYLDWA